MLWNLDDGRQLRSWRLPPGNVDYLAFHPSGNFLASANGDGKIDYWSTDGQPLQSFDWGVGNSSASA
jgi:WD40 repeat protein